MTLTINATEMPQSFTAAWGRATHGGVDCVIAENGRPVAIVLPLSQTEEERATAGRSLVEMLDRPRKTELSEEEADRFAAEAVQAARAGRPLP